MMKRVFYRVVYTLPVLILFTPAGLPQGAMAEGLRFRAEYDYTDSDSNTRNKTTNETFGSTFSRLDQQYDSSLTRTLYPNLTFSGGALYESDKSTSVSGGLTTRMDESTLRPFMTLTLNTPLFSSGFGYNQNQKTDVVTGVPTIRDTRDLYNGFLGYRPPELPSVKLTFTETHTYDHPLTMDSTEKLLVLNSDYSILSEALQLGYFYTRLEDRNGIAGYSVINQTNNGNISYSQDFFNKRISVETSYRVNSNNIRFSETADVETLLSRFSGLSGINDTPTNGPALLINNAMVDGNLTASSGIDIGLAGDRTTLTNIGLDFGFPVEIDKLYIWVDRSLPQTITNSFTWRIYTSPDNTANSAWTLISSLAQAPFGVFDNRFEISFPAQTTRFIKVVVQPLSPAITDASSFPNIFITEAQASHTSSGTSAGNKDKTLDQNYNLNLRGKLSDKTTLGYNLSYNSRRQEPSSGFRDRSETINDLYIQHLFNKKFSGSARLSRVDDTSDNVKSSSLYYTTSMRAAYFSTLNQTLTYSGNRTEEQDGESKRDAIFLRTNAVLYSGWSAFIDMGYSTDKFPGNPESSKSTTIRSGTNLEPNEKVVINLDYSATKTHGTETGNVNLPMAKLGLQVLYTPFPALSLNGQFQALETGSNRRTLKDYSINWSPFPDGGVQFNFLFSETLAPETGEKTRVIGPNVKWSIGRYASLDIFYNFNQSETSTMVVNTRSLIANLRLIF
jgi:hypothetical protein